MSNLQFKSLHNCWSGRIWTSMFFRYSLMLVSNCWLSFHAYFVTITLTDLFFSLQWLTLILTVSIAIPVFPEPLKPHRNTFNSGFSTENYISKLILNISMINYRFPSTIVSECDSAPAVDSWWWSSDHVWGTLRRRGRTFSAARRRLRSDWSRIRPRWYPA